ncbi:hypothetical protein DXG03_005777 [Asterophora parasitica]|uniref:Uncharacterized protein n=1 Tax=Asterophora parasitica TaxID=117018 RepID=A0A9P7G1L5_9AGAR|nr:hypothetical protein DXG03_005777 [Asterophora parasitica]
MAVFPYIRKDRLQVRRVFPHCYEMINSPKCSVAGSSCDVSAGVITSQCEERSDATSVVETLVDAPSRCTSRLWTLMQRWKTRATSLQPEEGLDRGPVLPTSIQDLACKSAAANGDAALLSITFLSFRISLTRWPMGGSSAASSEPDCQRSGSNAGCASDTASIAETLVDTPSIPAMEEPMAKSAHGNASPSDIANAC